MKKNALTWVVVAGCLVLFVTLRMRGIGHLLLWDEATDVCAARALAAGGGDAFSQRLWVHPPALPALSQLLRPLTPGFPERYEMLVLTINACAMVALFLLNRRIFGSATALLSCFFLAVMPGAIFFDVWIKGGCIVSLATIGAVAALMGGKPLLSGLCLGLALLDKETAGFSCFALFLLAIADPRHRNLKSIGALVVTTACTAGWWYLLLSSSFAYYATFAAASDEHGKLWEMPWHRYLVWLRSDVGPAGYVLLVLGMLSLAVLRRLTATPRGAYAWWPCALLLPAYAVLSAMPAKARWVLMFQYPALATLQALGVLGVTHALGRYGARRAYVRYIWFGTVAACALFMLGYSVTRRINRSGFTHAIRARALALAVNERIGPNERLLATTFCFNGPAFQRYHSPIFVHYLTNVQRLTVSSRTPFDECAALIVTNRLDWALLAPEPGAAAAAITNGFKTRFNLDPIILDNGTAFLYRIQHIDTEVTEHRR